MKKLKPAIVEWEDASSYTNKTLNEIINDLSTVKTYGLLVKYKKYYIVITHDGNGDSDFVKIPRSLVRKVTFLKPE